MALSFLIDLYIGGEVGSVFTEAVTDSETDQAGVLHVPSDGSPRHGRARSFMYLFADGRTEVLCTWFLHASDYQAHPWEQTALGRASQLPQAPQNLLYRVGGVALATIAESSDAPEAASTATSSQSSAT